jgi:hypothetical protein
MGDWEGRDPRWASLMDRKAQGEPLSAEELAVCERAAAEDPACRRELELLDELTELDVPPTSQSRALVDAALARLAAENEAREREEELALRAPPRRAQAAWLSGGAAAIAVAASWLLFARSADEKAAPAATIAPPRMELVYAAGDVQVDGAPVTFGATMLAEGSELRVGRGSACVALDPGIDVCASENTRLVLGRVHNPWRRLDLLEGKVGVQLSRQPEGLKLSIVADDVWSTAVGTAFTVERAEGHGVRTTVLHGKVRVGGSDGPEHIVSEHQRAEIRGEQAHVAPISRSDESPEWALLRPAKLWSNPVAATLEVRGAPNGAEVLLDGQKIGIAPLATLIPAGMHELALRVDGRIAATREFVSEVGQVASFSFAGHTFGAQERGEPPETAPRTGRAPRRALAPQPASASEPAFARPETAAPASDLLAEARRLLRAGRFEDAAARYAALRETHPHSPEAHTVLVSLAELQLDRLARPQQALDNLELYLRDGRGSLMEEARLARIRALRQIGRRDAERSAVAEFLREHPRSFKAGALEQRLGELDTRR